MIGSKTIGNFVSQWYHITQWQKYFPQWENGFKKDLPAPPPHKFIHVYVSNK